MDNDKEPEVYVSGQGIEILTDGTVRAERPWYSDYANIVRLVRHMARLSYSADEIADVVETPWSYEDLWSEMIDIETDGE